MQKRYTPEQIEFLRKNYMTMNAGQLTVAFNNEFGEQRTEKAMRSTLKNHQIKCGRKQKDRIVTKRLRLYTQDQADFITDNYAGRSVAELTKIFNKKFGDNKTQQQIKTFVHNRGIVSGRTGHFEKGHSPHNKGKKGWDAGGKSKKTRFKKGHRPQTWVPVGSYRRIKGNILQRKVSDTGYIPRDWKSVHSLVWEDHHGPVPKGYIVVFKHRTAADVIDENDIKIDELELVTRGENMKRNSIHNLPEALADVCRIKGVLNRHINKRIGK